MFKRSTTNFRFLLPWAQSTAEADGTEEEQIEANKRGIILSALGAIPGSILGGLGGAKLLSQVDNPSVATSLLLPVAGALTGAGLGSFVTNKLLYKNPASNSFALGSTATLSPLSLGTVGMYPYKEKPDPEKDDAAALKTVRNRVLGGLTGAALGSIPGLVNDSPAATWTGAILGGLAGVPAGPVMFSDKVNIFD
jgi:outer membrane lipoprotein SlyB